MIFDPNYKEIDIKGYEGLYKISNRGDVISLSKNSGFLKLKERIIKPTIKPKGYLDVKLTKDKKSKHFYIHRLVAEVDYCNCKHSNCCLREYRCDGINCNVKLVEMLK